jgi:hypothetical protein
MVFEIDTNIKKILCKKLILNFYYLLHNFSIKYNYNKFVLIIYFQDNKRLYYDIEHTFWVIIRKIIRCQFSIILKVVLI